MLAATPDGFFQTAVVDNLFGRFFGGTSHARPFYYYVYTLPLEFLPATLLLPFALAHARREWREPSSAGGVAWRLLACWTGVAFVFFSLSAGKRGAYLLPIHPALAIACGAGTAAALRERARLPAHAGLVLCAITIPTLVGLLAATNGALAGLPAKLGASPDVSDWPERLRPFAVTAGAALAGGLAAGAVAVGRRWSALPRLAVVGATLAALQAAVLHALQPALDDERSLRPVAEAAVGFAGPHGRVGVVRHRSMLPALAYYGALGPERLHGLETPDDVRAFLRDPGAGQNVLVVETNRLETVPDVPTSLLRTFRGGDRRVELRIPGDPADVQPD